MIRASVIICVYTEDRWDDIRNAGRLGTWRSPMPCARGRPSLAVDHNPGPAGSQAHQGRLPGRRARSASTSNAGPRGLSAGRNTGDRRPRRGDVVAFLDDDAVAEPGLAAPRSPSGSADPRP